MDGGQVIMVFLRSLLLPVCLPGLQKDRLARPELISICHLEVWAESDGLGS